MPEPALHDPAEIDAALFDPDQVDVGVVSLIDQLGIDIYDADGSLTRAASAPAKSSLRLLESEVRGLIEMGKADAAAIGAGQVPFTLADLYAGLAPSLANTSMDQMIGAYVAAYRAVPGDFIRGVLDGHPLVASTAFSRVHLWLLLFDGVIGRRPTTAAASMAMLSGLPLTAAAPVAAVNLNLIPSPLPGVSALDFAFVLAQLPLVGFTLDIDLTIQPATAHEGHGSNGPTVAIDARNHSPAVPLNAPISGVPILIPRSAALDGVPVIFESPDSGLLLTHGTFSGGFFGVPITTDVLGLAHLAYQLRQEPADGRGNVTSAGARINATVDLQQLVTTRYNVWPGAQGLIWGQRLWPGILVLEWHEGSQAGDYLVTLAGAHVGAGQYSGHADIYCTETPNGHGGSTWSVVSQPMSGGLTDFQMGEAPDYLSAEVSSQTEFDPWLADSRLAGGKATVTASRVGDLVHVQGNGSHTDSAGKKYTIEITVTCTPG